MKTMMVSLVALMLLACGPAASDETPLFADGRFSPRPASLQPVLDVYANFADENPAGVGVWQNQITALVAMLSSGQVDPVAVRYCLELVSWAMAVQSLAVNQELVPVTELRRQGIPEALTAQQYRDLRVLCDTWEGGAR